MGQSVSAEVAAKVSANRVAGRLCKGPTRSSLGCPAPATRVIVVTEKGSKRELTMCTRHAKGFPVGFGGENFRVTEVRKLEVKPLAQLAAEETKRLAPAMARVRRHVRRET